MLGGSLLGRLNVAMLCLVESRDLGISRAKRSEVQVRIVDIHLMSEELVLSVRNIVI
jgi:hypothetical protein